MEWNGLPIVIFGSGGISKETYFLIKEINIYNKFNVYNVIGFIEKEESDINKEIIDGLKVVGTDNMFEEFSNKYSILGVVVPIGDPKVKEIIIKKINNINNIVFPNIIHPTVRYDRDNILMGKGNILTSGTKITTAVEIGDYNLVNLNCTIGHDTKIGDYNVINPLCAISGDVRIGNGCLIGTGAKILQQLKIEDKAIVGAGSVVTKNVARGETVIGIPAKSMNK